MFQSTKETTLIQPNKVQVYTYFNSIGYPHIMLHVSACNKAILRHVNTKKRTKEGKQSLRDLFLQSRFYNIQI
jgi:hypothetical protein